MPFSGAISSASRICFAICKASSTGTEPRRSRSASVSPSISSSTGTSCRLIDAGDAYHDVCVAAFKTVRDPLITVWPAFTEAMYLLSESWHGQKALWSRVESDALTLAHLDASDAPRMRELMEKYRDLP